MVGETLLYHHFLIPMENQCSIKKICNQWCYEILFSYRFLILYSANYTFSICRNFEKRLSKISGRITNLTPLFFNCFSKRNILLSFPLSNRKREARQKPNLSLFLQKKNIVHKNFFRYLWPVVVFRFAKFTHKKYRIWMTGL